MITSPSIQYRERSSTNAYEAVFAGPGAWYTTWRWWLVPLARGGILVLTDLTALFASGLLSYMVWARLMFSQPLTAYYNLAGLFLLFPLAYAEAGLYPGFGIGAVETLRRCSRWTSVVFLVLAAATFAFKLSNDLSRVTFVIAWATALALVPLFRFAVLFYLRRVSWWGEPAILVGRGQWIQEAVRSLRNSVSLGYRPVAILTSNANNDEQTDSDLLLVTSAELRQRHAESFVQVALVEERAATSEIINLLQQHVHHVVLIRDEDDLPVEPVRTRNLGHLMGVEFTNNLLLKRNRFTKRMVDMLGGFLLLCAGAPLIFIGGLLIKFKSRGPVFFSQEREGMHGSPIKVWKLRTMYVDAERRLGEYLAQDPALRQQWETRFKLVDDPRILPGIGMWLRRFSIDELPQLWSVVTGKMSLVGPRPFPEYHLREFPEDFRELRRRVRPGLTGLWQIMVRSSGDTRQQRTYDSYYIRNWSLWLDLYILVRTIFAVLSGRGAS